jgi:hypothetical protein
MLLYQLMLKIIHVEGSCVICLFHCVMTRLDYMSNMTGVLYKAGAASHLQAPGFTQVVLVGSVFLIFLVFCVVLCFLFCLSSSCVLCTQRYQRHW